MSAMAGKYNFLIEQGTTVQFEIRIADEAGTPYDLTNTFGRMQIRPNYVDFVDVTTDLYVDISSSIEPDGTGLYFKGIGKNLPETSGSIGVFISANKTEEFDFDVALYDLELYEVDQGIGSLDSRGIIVMRILEGEIELKREVTR